MTEHNGNGAGSHLPQATEIMLSTGLRCWVYPLSQQDRMTLIQGWIKDHPEPNKKEYEQPVPEEDASFPGQTLAAESNPDYQRVLAERRLQLTTFITDAVLVGYTEFPDHSEQELIDLYARVIKRKRRVMDIPADDWEATLRYALIETPEDQGLIIQAVERRLPVTEEEIIDQVRIFRPDHQ